MKKFCFLLCIIGVFIVSCSKDNDITVQTEVEEEELYQQLLSDIEAYNSTYSFQPETRFGFLRKWATVLLCDAVGAGVGYAKGGFAGAVVLGVAASGSAFRSYPSQGVGEEPSVLGYTNTNLAFTYGIKPIGIVHNDIIRTILTYRPDLLTKLDEPQGYRSLINYINMESSGYGYGLNSSLTSDIIRSTQIIDMKTDLLSIDQTATNFRISFPSEYKMINVTKDFVERAATLSNPAQLSTYTTGYLGTISRSGLSQATISSMQSSVVVGANSCVLWEARPISGN